ncbi:hypothetical protein PHET_02621 [Paragonimus heterotremus]|uniref:Uncharacterized protein n=1 Tax=Paragonimus heterotremus TaxID=100268 RepID=A0A8J4SS91_9TREM|nr:hypothetical protein PHET_02621 [Paragonimus heterotremus]
MTLGNENSSKSEPITEINGTPNKTGQLTLPTNLASTPNGHLTNHHSIFSRIENRMLSNVPGIPTMLYTSGPHQTWTTFNLGPDAETVLPHTHWSSVLSSSDLNGSQFSSSLQPTLVYNQSHHMEDNETIYTMNPTVQAKNSTNEVSLSSEKINTGSSKTQSEWVVNVNGEPQFGSIQVVRSQSEEDLQTTQNDQVSRVDYNCYNRVNIISAIETIVKCKRCL